MIELLTDRRGRMSHETIRDSDTSKGSFKKNTHAAWNTRFETKLRGVKY